MPIGHPLVEEAAGTETAERLGRSWVVVVWDDPINLMSYVTLVLQRVFTLPREQAEQLMLKVHHEGRAVVASEAREQAELHVAQLHAYGLQATMEPEA
jgi:ATP-dependent Clp protease adaptor protein ClpS